ncbi:hypothetical protein EMCRGX_G026861 [Ephydatia muelleri]
MNSFLLICIGGARGFLHHNGGSSITTEARGFLHHKKARGFLYHNGGKRVPLSQRRQEGSSITTKARGFLYHNRDKRVPLSQRRFLHHNGGKRVPPSQRRQEGSSITTEARGFLHHNGGKTRGSSITTEVPPSQRRQEGSSITTEARLEGPLSQQKFLHHNGGKTRGSSITTEVPPSPRRQEGSSITTEARVEGSFITTEVPPSQRRQEGAGDRPSTKGVNEAHLLPTAAADHFLLVNIAQHLECDWHKTGRHGVSKTRTLSTTPQFVAATPSLRSAIKDYYTVMGEVMSRAFNVLRTVSCYVIQWHSELRDALIWQQKVIREPIVTEEVMTKVNQL